MLLFIVLYVLFALLFLSLMSAAAMLKSPHHGTNIGLILLAEITNRQAIV